LVARCCSVTPVQIPFLFNLVWCCSFPSPSQAQEQLFFFSLEFFVSHRSRPNLVLLVELIFFVCLGQVLSKQSPPPRPYFLCSVSSFPCEASPVSVQIDLAVGARFLLGLRGKFSRGQDLVVALARFLGIVFCCRRRSERAAISQSVFRLSFCCSDPDAAGFVSLCPNSDFRLVVLHSAVKISFASGSCCAGMDLVPGILVSARRSLLLSSPSLLVPVLVWLCAHDKSSFLRLNFVLL
jgi:hypothetical protein